jgi:hypothetical protein
MSVEGTVAPILPLMDYLTGRNQIQADPHNPMPARLLVVPPWQREYVWTPSDAGEVGILLDDLYEFVLKAVERDGKHVVVGGLDGDCFRKPFGQILQLIPLADRVTKLSSLCKGCGDGTIGLFTFRTTKSKEIVEVGGSETYMPLCRKHYLECSAIQDGDCPKCSSALAGSVYRPRCSECAWSSETTNDSESSNQGEPLPTIQERVAGPPIMSLPTQTTEDICQTSQSE